MSLHQRIHSALQKRQKENAMRSRIIIERKSGRFIIHNGKQYYNFSGNDYLGLSQHPAVIYAWKKGADLYGIGSGGSGHISGYTKVHHQLEEELACWLGYSRALLFISGFAANQAVITSLMSKNDYIIADRLSHASLLEAAKLNFARIRRFHHNDVRNLAFLLQRTCTGEKLTVTEGIFSMDGDSAPLSDIQVITQLANSWLMVDDAHGFGVVGEKGKGSCDNYKIKPELLVITFSKGVGVSGAAVLCNEDIADYLLQYANHVIYSTSMPPAQAMAVQASLNIIKSKEGEELRQKLIKNIQHFRDGVKNLLHIFPLKSNYAIQPCIIGENKNTLFFSQRLRQKNIWAIAIRPPTVPLGKARLRLTLSAVHETADITVLLEALHETSR